MSHEELINKSDVDLMLLCQNGRTEAFEALYFKYRQPVINFAYQMLRNYEDAADVFQDTFKYLFSKIESYEPTAKFSTLLFKVARNLCIDILRKRKRRHVQQLDTDMDVEDPSRPGEPSLDSVEVEGRIKEALEEIPDTFREVVILRLLHEKSYEEIRDVLQCPVGTVKSRLHSGMEMLRKILKRKKIVD